MNSTGNRSNTLIKRNTLWHRIVTKCISFVCYMDKGHLDRERKRVNQPVTQRRKNMEFSPNKKAMPIIISKAANVMALVSSYCLHRPQYCGADENNNCNNSPDIV